MGRKRWGVGGGCCQCAVVVDILLSSPHCYCHHCHHLTSPSTPATPKQQENHKGLSRVHVREETKPSSVYGIKGLDLESISYSVTSTPYKTSCMLVILCNGFCNYIPASCRGQHVCCQTASSGSARPSGAYLRRLRLLSAISIS